MTVTNGNNGVVSPGGANETDSLDPSLESGGVIPIWRESRGKWTWEMVGV